jgi:hypothetical protein
LSVVRNSLFRKYTALGRGERTAEQLVQGTAQTDTCSQIARKVCASTTVLKGDCHDLIVIELVIEVPCTRRGTRGEEQEWRGFKTGW